MTENKDSVLLDIKRIFAEGDKHIVLSESKQIVLVLGNSGAGKSTLVQLLAGDNNSLIAEEKIEGLGDYWIYDENNKISKNDTLLSKTIFPELVVDSKTKTAFYDCPGFNDNRNSSIDIGGTYFIRKIINHAEEIKIILTVNYDSLQKAENLVDLPALLTHSTTLIKNIDKFNKSILLVASKVDRDPDFDPATNEYIPVKDEKIVNEIASFLAQAKITLGQKAIDSQSAKDRKTNEDSVKLLDVFLAKQGTDYTNIALFHKSNMPGKVSEIPLLQQNKVTLNNKIHNNLKFTRRNDNDFGYTISPTSQIFISDLVDQINKELSKTLNVVAKEITTLNREKEKNIRDIYDLKGELMADHKKISNFMNKMKGKDQVKTLIVEITKGLAEWNIKVSKSNEIKNIANQYDHLDFLQKVANKDLKLTTQQIIQPFQEALDSIRDTAHWYEFFVLFYNKLFSYEVQEDGRKYDKFVDAVSEWKQKKSKVFGFSIKDYMKEIVIKVPGFDSIENLEMDELKLEVLSDLVESALKNNVISTCVDGTKLEFRGTWIKTSDMDNSDYDKCQYAVESVEVFALRRFIVDSDYYRRSSKQKVVVIAPIWHIMKDSEINISGHDGRKYPKAKNGAFPSGIGEDGVPGRRGVSGGSFLGIGSRFINGSKLKIVASAGTGGDGQEGGDGGKGMDGENNSCKWYNGWPHVFRKGLQCTVSSPDKDSSIYKIGDDSDGEHYRLEGGLGKSGGKSGYGGDGAIDGRMGEISILQLKGKSNIQTEVKYGYLGSSGKAGTPGAPGHDGNACTAYFYANWAGTVKYWHKVICKIPFGKFARPAGWKNRSYKEGEKQDEKIYVADSTEMINKYKNYIKQNFNDRFNLKEYPKFYRELQAKPTILRSEGKLDHTRETRSIMTNETVPFLGDEKLYYPNLINSQEYLYNDSNSKANLNSGGFTLNNTLLLIDVVIRKLTGSKPIHTTSYDTNQKPMEIMAKSLNIIEKFENLLAKFSKSEMIRKKYLTTDFSSLVGKVQTELTKRYNVEEITKILYDSVAKNNWYQLNDIEVSHKFKKIIMKMVKKEIEEIFNNPKMMKMKNQLNEINFTHIANNDIIKTDQFIDQQSAQLIN